MHNMRFFLFLSYCVLYRSTVNKSCSICCLSAITVEAIIYAKFFIKYFGELTSPRVDKCATWLAASSCVVDCQVTEHISPFLHTVNIRYSLLATWTFGVGSLKSTLRAINYLIPIFRQMFPRIDQSASCPSALYDLTLSEIYKLLHVPRLPRLSVYGRLLCWSVRLEQSPGPCPQPELHRSCFQAPAKDKFCSHGTSAPSALWGFTNHQWCAVQIYTFTASWFVGESSDKWYSRVTSYTFVTHGRLTRRVSSICIYTFTGKMFAKAGVDKNFKSQTDRYMRADRAYIFCDALNMSHAVATK